MHRRKKKPQCSIILPALVLLMIAVVSDTTDRTGVSQATTEDTTDKLGNWQVIHDETVDQTENIPETKNDTLGKTGSLERADHGTVDISGNSRVYFLNKNTTDKCEGSDFNEDHTLDHSGNLPVTDKGDLDKAGHFQVNNTSKVGTMQKADLNTFDFAEYFQEPDVNTSDKVFQDKNTSEVGTLQEADLNTFKNAEYLQEADINTSDKAGYLQVKNTSEVGTLQEADINTANKPGLPRIEILDSSRKSTTAPPFDSNSVLNKIATCKGRCGQVISQPCSCDKQCMVYRNCCEGMAEDCPQIWDEGNRKYNSSLNFQVRCSKNGYFMIDSCNKIASVAEKDSTAETEPSAGTKFVFGTKNFEIASDSEIRRSVLTLTLTNSIVTDTVDGITYASPEIYFCIHQQSTSSTLVPWDVSHSLTNVEQPSDLADLEDSIDTLTLEFIPPSSVSAYSRRCIPQALTTCENYAVLQTNPDLRPKCKSFTSYVRAATSSQITFYNNRFCFQCSENRHGDFIPTFQAPLLNLVYDFSVLISRVSGNKVALYAEQSSLVREQILPWKRASCNLSELYHIPGVYEKETKQFEKTSCRIDECYSNYEKKRDGKCKKLHILKIGIAEDGYPLTSLEKRQWPFFLGCVLEKHFNLEIGNIGMQILSVYDRTLGRTLYTSNIAIFLPVLDPLYSLTLGEDGWSMALALSVKAFKDYRQRNLLLFSNGNIIRADDRPSDVDIETYNIPFTFPNFHDSKRGPLLDNTVTTVCLTSANSMLGCWEDPLYVSDTLELIELSQSSCFDHLHVQKQDSDDGKNEAATFLGEQTFMRLFCVGLLGMDLF